MNDFGSVIRTVQVLDREKEFSKLRSLIWFQEDVGWYPVLDKKTYDDEYFNKYVGYRETDLGVKINQFRASFVRKFTDAQVLDIGSGAGHFIDVLGGKTIGFDVNPASQKWLQARGIYCDWRNRPCELYEALTFWDSLEHICEFWRIIRKLKVGGHAFMTIPTFIDQKHVLISKHFRQDEHYWYFTKTGLIEMMKSLGLENIVSNNVETMFGRQGVETFAFRKVNEIEIG